MTGGACSQPGAAVLLCTLWVLTPDGSPSAQEPVRDPAPLRVRMLTAEDGRPAPDAAVVSAPDPLEPLYEGLTSVADIQVLAVRGLGRLERPDLVPRLSPLLTARSPAVRAEAANALAQAVVRGGDAAAVFGLLRARVGRDDDPLVRAALARSLGRLPYRTPAEVDEAVAAILAVAGPGDPGAARPAAGARASAAGDASALVTLLGIAQGLESLSRRTAAIRPIGEPARARLATLLRFGLDDRGAESLAGSAREDARRIRRLSVSALTAAGGMTRALLGQAVADGDAEVRRLAVVATRRMPPDPWALDVVERATLDADPRVRIDALRRRGEVGGRVACEAARIALTDGNLHVVLEAIDLAGRACDGDTAAVRAVDDLAVPPPPGSTGRAMWHRSARALLALARLQPARARERLPGFAGHAVWQVRMYAARSAGIVSDVTVLETLGRDPDPNVSEAAVAELSRRAGRRADPLLIEALARPDGQLVLTAARALAGTALRAEATRALLTSLARMTVEQRETSRDVRMAVVERLEETGPALPSTVDELAAYVNDFDPVVAARVAALLTKWRGVEVRAHPRPLPRAPLPSLERLAALRETEAVVTMAGGGTFRMRLFPDEAPTNVARFARLSAARFFDGLTFHRVEPTFVIQGGSPHANEYAGDGRFTRDEVGLRSHVRGTVGVSTRGRDTGDGQIFVNLVDNPRLDHNYTIIGEIVAGLDVVDGILQGGAIRSVVLERQARSAGR